MADEFEGVRLIIPGSPEKEKPQKPEAALVNENTSPNYNIGDDDEDDDDFVEGSSKLFSSPRPTTSAEDVQENVYSALVKELAERGLIELPEENVNIESADDLLGLFDNTINGRIKDNVEDFKKSFSGAKKLFLEIEDAFDDELQAMKVARDLDYYNNLTTSVVSDNVNVQKDILFRYLSMKGMSRKEVEEAITEAEALSKLEDKALSVLPQLKKSAVDYVDLKRKEKEEREEREKKRYEEDFNTLLKGTEEINEIVPGVQLTGRHKSAIKEAMTKIAYTDPETGAQYTDLGYKQVSNPQGFERLIQYYNILGLFNVNEKGEFKPDLNKLVKLTEKQVKRKLDELIREQQQTSVPGAKSSAGTKLNLSFWDDAFNTNK